MSGRQHWYRTGIFLNILLATLWGLVPAQAQPETLTIAAANSLKDALRKVLDVNVVGPFLGMKLTRPFLKANGGGS